MTEEQITDVPSAVDLVKLLDEYQDLRDRQFVIAKQVTELLGSDSKTVIPESDTGCIMVHAQTYSLSITRMPIYRLEEFASEVLNGAHV